MSLNVRSGRMMLKGLAIGDEGLHIHATIVAAGGL